MRFIGRTAASFLFALAGLQPAIAQLTIDHVDANGGSGTFESPRDAIPESEQQRVWSGIQSNLRQLEALGRIAPLDTTKATEADLAVRFSWPTRLASGRPEFLDHVVSFYIDQDPVAGSARDFSCGGRSYDTSSVNGGHKGTDISMGPRGFYKMDTQQVLVVAAAPGIIAFKDDANPDRSCGDLTVLFSQPLKNNVISVQHADGSVAIYFHIKTGSATTKNVGDAVAEGEYLATVGSSGYSAGPHLHFEVRNAANAVVDPWLGACNPTTSVSLWKSQEPYISKEILLLMPTSTVPTTDNTTTACVDNVAAPETAADYVQPDLYAQAAVTHHFMAIIRDREPGDQVLFSLRRPDGIEYTNGTVGVTSYSPSGFAFISRTIPASEPAGKWSLAVTYGGKTKTTPFYFRMAKPSPSRVYEFYNAGLDHYFRTASAAEAASLTPTSGFLPTGDDYFALDRAVALAGTSPVCRFYGSVNPGPNSHFYTADPGECAGLKQLAAQIPASQPRWNYEETAFAAYLPVNGVCPVDAPFPIYRLYNKHQGESVNGKREDSNHRFTTFSSVYYQMMLASWAGEGVVMCAGSKP